MYELKIALFKNGDPEELFIFQQKFQMTFEAPGNIAAGKKIIIYIRYYMGKRCVILKHCVQKLGTLPAHTLKIFWN